MTDLVFSNSAVFTVRAYRWGATNNHAYAVYATTDKAKALEVAEQARDERGGKYGVCVEYFDAEKPDGIFHGLLAHFSSLAGEAAPYEDDNKEVHATVGYEICRILSEGTIQTLGKELSPGVYTTKMKKVRVPQWLREALREAAYMEMLMRNPSDDLKKVFPTVLEAEPGADDGGADGGGE